MPGTGDGNRWGCCPVQPQCELTSVLTSTANNPYYIAYYWRNKCFYKCLSCFHHRSEFIIFIAFNKEIIDDE